jgi:hypothetical protein
VGTTGKARCGGNEKANQASWIKRRGEKKMTYDENDPANPAPNQLPQHRQDEWREEMRVLREQNQQLRSTLDQVMLRQQQPQTQQVPEETPFDPKVDEAIKSRFKSLLSQETAQFKNAIGFLTEQNDQLRFQQMYGVDTYNKYKDKIKSVRDERTRMGQYVTHEDAYKYVAYDETQRKPQQKPEPAQSPVFDSYLGRFLTPEEIKQNPALQQAQPAQQPMQQQQRPMQQMQQPMQQQMQPGIQQEYPQPNFPQPNRQQQQIPRDPQNADFGLPPVGTPNPGVMGGAQPQSRLDLTTTDKGLEAFADKYGDIPL